jgi:hypothetical protein
MCTIAEQSCAVVEHKGDARSARRAPTGGVGMNIAHPPVYKTLGIEEARRWIGRSLVLCKPLLGFDAGTRCVVMCLVDFGDGLLLWVTTDDKYAVDIDQVSLQDLQEYFRLVPAAGVELRLHQSGVEAK